MDVSERHSTETAPAGRADRSPGGYGSPAPPTTLSQRLRVETVDAHRAAERAFDLDRRLSSLADYGNTLQAFDAFAATSAPMLEALVPALPVALRDGPARRRSRLHGDLARLGRLPTSPDRAIDPTEIDLNRALGTWYVHEGSALGGLLIAAEVRRRLPEAKEATTFFAGEGHGTAARWRAVQAVLDNEERVDGERVVSGARATFAALTERLAAVIIA